MLTGAPGPAVAAARTDTETWTELRRRLRAFVARRVGSADVDDVVQGVFLRLQSGAAGIRDRDRVHAWLHTTARRAVVDYYRGRARSREVFAGGAADLDALDTAPAWEDASDDRAEVAACLAPVAERLAPADREAIALVEVEDLPLAAAASRLGLGMPAMKSRIQRARRRLRDAILACCRVALDGTGMPIACASRTQGGCSR